MTPTRHRTLVATFAALAGALAGPALAQDATSDAAAPRADRATMPRAAPAPS